MQTTQLNGHMTDVLTLNFATRSCVAKLNVGPWIEQHNSIAPVDYTHAAAYQSHGR